MKNIEMSTEGNVLTIKVDLAQRFGKSSSGKSTIVASTEGNQSVPIYPWLCQGRTDDRRYAAAFTLQYLSASGNAAGTGGKSRLVIDPGCAESG